MAAAKYKLKLEQGTTLRKLFTWKAAGVAMDFTGYTARMQIRPDIDSTEIIASLTTENGGIELGADGVFTLFISAADTALFTFDSAVYDLEFVAPNGDVIRLMQGAVSLSLEVTR